MVTRLLLLKHATSTWNEAGLWQGSRDEPLSESGRREAARAVAALTAHGVTRLACSDLKRACKTAEILADGLKLPPPVIEKRLREYDAGQWEGLRRSQIEARWPEALAAWRDGTLSVVPGGEDREGFLVRILAGVRSIAEMCQGLPLIVTHGGVIEALTARAGAAPLPMRSMSGRWFELEDGAFHAGPQVDLGGVRA